MIKKLMAVIIALSFAGAEPVYPTQYDQLASSEEVKWNLLRTMMRSPPTPDILRTHYFADIYFSGLGRADIYFADISLPDLRWVANTQ